LKCEKYLICVLLSIWSAFFQLGSLHGQNIGVDTTTVLQDTTPTKRTTFFDIFSGNPGRAALYSLVVPGGGQAYNKKWWKVPVAIGIDGLALSNVFFNKSNFKKYDGIYKNLLAGGKDPDFFSPTDVKPIRDAYRQRYEYAWVYFGIAHLVTVFDAFVDRHLIEFDISEDLTYFDKNLNTSGATPIICITIPINW